MRAGEPDPQLLQRANNPVAVVEAVDPIVLDARIMDCCGKRECDCDLCEVPSFVNECFGGELSSGDDSRRIYVTLGQFSIVGWSGTPSCWCRCTTTACPTRSAPAATAARTPAPCSATSPSRWGSFFPPNTVKQPECDIKPCCK